MSDPVISIGGPGPVIPDIPKPTDEAGPLIPPVPVDTSAAQEIPAVPTPQQEPDLSGLSWNQLDSLTANAADTARGLDAPDVVQQGAENAKAALYLSKMYDIPLSMVTGNLENAAHAIYGQKVAAPNIIQKVSNTVAGTMADIKIGQLGLRAYLGDDEVWKEIEAAQKEKPTTDEMLGGFGRAVFNTLVGMGYTAFTGVKGQLVGSAASTIGSLLLPGPLAGFAQVAGTGTTLGIILKQQFETMAGGQYVAMVQAGIDPTTARVATGALFAGLEALNLLKVESLPGVKNLASEAILEGTKRALLSGSFAKVALDFGKRAAASGGTQGLLSLASSVYSTAITEAAKYLETKINGTTFTRQNFLDVLKEWGVQTAAGAATGILFSVPGLAEQNAGVKANIEAVVRRAQNPTEPDAGTPSAVPSAATTETGPAPYVPPSPYKFSLRDILQITDRQAEALDAHIKSTESSADYIKGTDLTGKQAVDRYRAMLEARTLIKKYVADIAAIDTSKMRPEFAAPIQEILDHFTVERFNRNTQARLETLRTQLEQTPGMDLPPEMLYKLGELHKTPLKDLSVEDLGTIHDAIMNYAKLARDAHTLNVAGQMMARDEAVTQIVKEMKPPPPAPEGTIKANAGPMQRFRGAVKNIIGTVGMRAERFDLVTDRISPTLRKATFDAANQGWKDTLAHVHAFNDEFQSRLSPVSDTFGSLNKFFTQKETIVLSDKNSVVADRATKLALYMNAIAPENRAHVLEGGVGFRNAGPELRNQPIKVSKEALDAIVAQVNANPHEKLVVDTVIDMLRRLGDEQAKVYLELNDIPLQLVKGVYYHIDTMPVGRGSDVETEAVSTAAKRQFVGIGMYKGQLKSRTGSTAPIWLDPITYGIAFSRDHAAAYINLEKPLRNASRVLGDSTFKDALRKSTGAKTHGILVKALKDLAGQVEPVTNTELYSLKLRNRMSTAYMGLPNVFVPLKQPIAWLRYSAYVKPKYLLEGMFDSLMHPRETEKTMVRNSAAYAERSRIGRSMEAADVLRQAPAREIGGKVGFLQKLMAGVGYFDTRGSVRPGMRGAVLQALDEMRPGATVSEPLKMASGKSAEQLQGLSLEDQVKAAYKFAEWVTERTQTSGNPLLQSDFQRGSPIEKGLSIFMSEGFTGANLRRQAFLDARRAGTRDGWVRFAKVVLLTLVAEPLYEMGVNRLRRWSAGQEQPELTKDAAAQMIHQLFSGIPGINALENAVTNRLVLGWNARSNSLTPLDNLADSTINLINLATSRKSYTTRKGSLALAKAVADVSGLLSGLPLSPTVRMAETISNIVGGKP